MGAARRGTISRALWRALLCWRGAHDATKLTGPSIASSLAKRPDRRLGLPVDDGEQHARRPFRNAPGALSDGTRRHQSAPSAHARRACARRTPWSRFRTRLLGTNLLGPDQRFRTAQRPPSTVEAVLRVIDCTLNNLCQIWVLLLPDLSTLPAPFNSRASNQVATKVRT